MIVIICQARAAGRALLRAQAVRVVAEVAFSVALNWSIL